MSSNELILRRSAYGLLVSFVEFSVQIPKLEVKSGHEMLEVMVTFIADGCWIEACIQHIWQMQWAKRLLFRRNGLIY